MKKLLALISALALCLSLAQAQTGPGPGGDGPGTGDGSGTMEGPFGNNGGLWTYIEENLPDTLQDEYDAVIETRAILRQSRIDWLAENDTLEGWFETETENIKLLRESVEALRDWFREVRPDRPDPVMTGDMVRRRLRFKTNSDGITETQKRLRLMLQNDPDNPECQQLREQLGNLLGERKQLLREQRRGEGGPGGEGDGNHRGG